MEFLDSIEFQSVQEKSQRMRSWYLYEQYKALEKNQLDAAQRLKSKWQQDKVLCRELPESRPRRLRGERAGVTPSESGIDSIASDGTCITSSDHEFFETFSDIHRNDRIPCFEHETESTSTGDTGFTFHGLTNEKDNKEAYEVHKNEYKIAWHEEHKGENKVPREEECKDEGKASQFDIFKSEEECNVISLCDTIESLKNTSEDKFVNEVIEELDLAKKNIAENIHLQFENVKENIHCLEEYTKLHEDSNIYKYSDNDCTSDNKSGDDLEDNSNSVVSFRSSGLTIKSQEDKNKSIFALWSKIVSFAYQAIQHNRGSCYYDYSAQFLTAVLACDVLWRGVTRMCRVLQPYVSPIQFQNDIEESDISIKKQIENKRKKTSMIKKDKKNSRNNSTISKKSVNVSLAKNQRKFRDFNKRNQNSDSVYTCNERRCHSEQGWRNRGKKELCLAAPWRSLSRIRPCLVPSSERLTSTIWPEEMNSSYTDDSPRARVTNPMLQLATYIDTILRDIESDL